MRLHTSFLDRPIAHRALHDRASGRVENAPSSVSAAIDAGYGIEIDLQLSKDGQAMVFHDDYLYRLTGQSGMVRDYTAHELGQMKLIGSDETIPTLEKILELVSGQTPVLIELKDQTLGLVDTDGELEKATCANLQGYQGEVALMSFNPHCVAHCQNFAPDRPRGLTTCSFAPSDWPEVDPTLLATLMDMPHFDKVGACFISHDVNDLSSNIVQAKKSAGHPILCWTVKSQDQADTARLIADNITFEGFLPV